jgi:hypothetical protein
MIERLDPVEWGLSPQARIYRAGELVPPGRYGRLDRPGAFVTLARGGYLAPSFDGSVALYARVATASDLLGDRVAPVAAARP